MSSTYRMNVVWSSQGAQLQRDLQALTGTLGTMERGVTRNQQQMSMWGQQMRAIGTTIRYAFAGAIVYSVASAVSSLGDFEARLGEIDSLAARIGQGGQLEGLGGNLQTVGDIALNTSNKIGVSVDQIQQHMIGFYSAFEAPSGKRGIKQMQEFVNAMANLTLISEGADPNQLSRAVAAMSRDVRTGQLAPGRAGDIVDVIAQILQTTPNIRGEDIARDLGRLSAARVAARMTPEEILGVYGQAAKAGGSAAVIGRGVAQLLTTGVVRPRTKTEIDAFQAAVGTADPTALRKLGGLEVLRRMMRAVAPRGLSLNAGARQALGDETLTDQQALDATGGQLKGINLTLATQLFGRQESLRVFLNLLSQGGPKAMNAYIDSVKEAEKQNRGSQRAALVNQQRWFQQLGTSQKNFGLSIMRGLEPALRPLAQGLTGVFRAGGQHPLVSLGVIGAGATAGIAAKLGLAGALSGRLPGRLGRLLGGRAGGLGQAALASEIGGGLSVFSASGLPSGVAGQAGAGSRGNPFWVVIDPISWYLPGAPSAGGGTGGATPSPRGGGGLGGFLRRQAGRFTGALGGAAGGAAAAGRGALLGAGVTAAIGLADIAAILATPGDTETHRGRFTPDMAKRYPFLARLVGNIDKRHFSRGTREQIHRFAAGDISAGHFERWLRQMALRNAQGHGQLVSVDGEALLKMQIDLAPDVKRLLKLSAPQGVPVKLWTQGSPQHRGKNKSHRNWVPPGARGPVG